MLNLDYRDARPIYEQVKDGLRRLMVSGAIRARQQFIGREDGKIAAAYILNHECEPAYHAAHWQTDAAEGEYVVMHALRVLPRYGGRGYSRRMIEHAIQTAREWNQKAIRLDVLVGNTVPEKIYTSCAEEKISVPEDSPPAQMSSVPTYLSYCAPGMA